MRAVIQRVLKGKVTVQEKNEKHVALGAGDPVGEIGPGLVVLLGVATGDTKTDAVYMAEKTVHLRIFEDEEGKLNLSALDLKFPILVVSQFTLYGDCRKGRRPNFTEAAPPELGEHLYEIFCAEIRKYGLQTSQGRFRSRMLVEIYNDGPVTILLDSKRII